MWQSFSMQILQKEINLSQFHNLEEGKDGNLITEKQSLWPSLVKRTCHSSENPILMRATSRPFLGARRILIQSVGRAATSSYGTCGLVSVLEGVIFCVQPRIF